MNGLVTAGRPASALLDAQGVIGAADENLPAADLLEVAFQAEVGVARRQEFCIDRSVGSVAGGASFAHRFVLEDERPALGGMAADAAFVLGEKGAAAASVNGAFVRRMAGRATEFVFGHGMMIGKTKLAADIRRGTGSTPFRWRGAAGEGRARQSCQIGGVPR